MFYEQELALVRLISFFFSYLHILLYDSVSYLWGIKSRNKWQWTGWSFSTIFISYLHIFILYFMIVSYLWGIELYNKLVEFFNRFFFFIILRILVLHVYTHVAFRGSEFVNKRNSLTAVWNEVHVCTLNSCILWMMYAILKIVLRNNLPFLDPSDRLYSPRKKEKDGNFILALWLRNQLFWKNQFH